MVEKLAAQTGSNCLRDSGNGRGVTVDSKMIEKSLSLSTWIKWLLEYSQNVRVSGVRDEASIGIGLMRFG